MSKITTHWSLKDTDFDRVLRLANHQRITHTTSEVLVGRGIDTPRKLREFKDLSLKALHSPWLLDDIEPCVERLAQCVRNQEVLTLWGDYDVDGVASTTIVVNAIRRLGGVVDPHVPNRMVDGYDARPKAVDIARRNGGPLITVDCGIRAFDTADYARERGVDMIVTDHHHPSDDGRLPGCVAVVNPSRLGSAYPFHGLVGAAVAMKVTMALAQRMGENPEDFLEMALEFAALGTVADVGPMEGENRVIVQHGVEALNATTRPGVRELINVAGVAKVDAEAIGFQLGPRINAVGRIGDSREALDLMLEEHPREAKRRAAELDTWNRKRQDMTVRLMAHAESAVGERDPSEPTILVVWGPLDGEGSKWHPGLVGLAAGRLAEAHAVPCLAITVLGDGFAKGSCRSTRDYDILSALMSERVKPLFTKCGGHKFAAGFTLPEANLETLRAELHDYAQGTMAAPQKTLDIDAVASASDLTIALREEMHALAPFGNGHPEPTLMTGGMIVREAKTMSEGKHLKLTLSDAFGRGWYDAVMWQKGKRAAEVQAGSHVDVAYKLSVNSFMGRTKVQLMLEDFRSTQQ